MILVDSEIVDTKNNMENCIDPSITMQISKVDAVRNLYLYTRKQVSTIYRTLELST